jgi:hypothetical protein
VTFLNAVLLAGMAAVSIPVIIHLFHRSKFRIVPWGAMHLLESVLRKNTRRLRLEQLILLLIRCSIPVLLAVCMARPVLTGLEPLLGHAKSSTVVLLDNSYSMESGGGERSNFAQAKEAVRQILDQQVQGSDVAVVEMAGGVSVLLDEPTYDLDRLRAEVGRARAGYGSAAAPEALSVARALLSRMKNPHKEVVVLSDFQKVSWSDQETAARINVADALRQGPLKPDLTLFHVGQETLENVSVESLDPSRLILGVGQQLRVRATLRNHGDAPYPDLRVVFRVDGRERDVARTSLGARETGQVLFTHAFESPGSHVIEVVAEADPLQADNSLLKSILVWDRVPVLLVSGDSNPEPLRGETDFVEIALRPYGAAKVELADLITTRVVEPRDLDAKALAETRVVLLANVPQLQEAQLRALETFVREGGGLLVFPGNRINSAWYNTALAAGGKGLLPLPVASLAGSLNQSGTQASVVGQHFEHPALEMFNDPRNGNLSDAQIWLWYRMRADASALRDADPSLAVLAKLDTGDPFLVEKRYGEGRVLQSCLPCDADWSNLPMRPFYLPLMQQLTTYLASSVYPPRNVEVGKPLTAFLPVADSGKKAVLTDPDNRAWELVAANRGSRAVVEFAKTQKPGLYLLDAPGGAKIHFVVNTDRKESELAQLPPAELQGIAKAMDARIVRSWSEYRQLDQERRFGQEVWPFLLLAVLVLVFVEMLLEQLFARRKS